MRSILAIFSLILINFTLSAQALVFQEDTLTAWGSANSFEFVAYGVLNASDTNDITVVWERTMVNVPTGWITQVCDKQFCWSETTNNGRFTMNARRGERLDIHFKPNGTVGDGYVTMKVYVEGDSAATAITAYYSGKASPVSTKQSLQSKPEILFYPNPVKDFLHIDRLPFQSTYSLKIYNILGVEMATFHLHESSTTARNATSHMIPMQTLPKGVFLARLFDQDKQLIVQKSITLSK